MYRVESCHKCMRKRGRGVKHDLGLVVAAVIVSHEWALWLAGWLVRACLTGINH